MNKRRCGAHRAWAALFALHAMLAPAWAGPMGISSTEPLTFGKFASPFGGSVFVDSNGARSTTGSVVLLSSTPGSAARFEVSGDPNLTYSISLPANGTASLVNGSGQSMALSDFTSTPASTGLLNGAGRQILSVGARLSVGANQPSGSYSGSFVIYVDYN